MLTKNYFTWLKGCHMWISYYGTDLNGVSKSITNLALCAENSGGFHNAMRNAMAQDYAVSTSGGVWFGSGNKPATIDDYKLESVLTTGFSVTKPSKISLSTTGEYIEFSATYRITATADISISEIGLFAYDSSTLFMVDRTVLETPIEILKGKSKQVTYTIRFNYPTA